MCEYSNRELAKLVTYIFHGVEYGVRSRVPQIGMHSTGKG